MRRCPLSYQMVEGRYHPTALRSLHPRLQDLADLPYTTEDLLWEAGQRADRLSIQGVQPKLSARLKVARQTFELVDQLGTFILKPQNARFPALPENEDLTMRLARLCRLETPQHGLIHGMDGRLTYWIRRFDRTGRDRRLPVEDFAQLSGENRETKYRSSLEKVAKIVSQHCTFAEVEKVRLLRLVLFNFLCGNEDQHLKNFSLITDGVVRISPCYDLLNSSIVLRDPEETALPVRGKKRRLKSEDLLDYYGGEVLGLNASVVEGVLQDLAGGLARWEGMVRRSFLPEWLQDAYLDLAAARSARLGFRFVHDASPDVLPKQQDGGRLCLTSSQAGALGA